MSMDECTIEGCDGNPVEEKYSPITDEWYPYCELHYGRAYFTKRRKIE